MRRTDRPSILAYFATLLLAASVALAGCSPAQPSPPASAQTQQEIAATSAAQAALPDRLEIPGIDVDIPVVELGWHAATTNDGAIFSEWDVAEYAAGWHKNSALPGQPGNIVLSGHNNILGAVFRELDQLRAGDVAILWTGDDRHVYRVDQVLIVPEKNATAEQRAANAQWIEQFDDDRLTLVSCWPRNNNTHRIIVVARPVDSAGTAHAAGQ